MSQIPTPHSIQDAPQASQALLESVNKQLGSVPNLFRIVSNSPSALKGYLDLSGALATGKLTPAVREGIALAVAETNGCSYCLAAHTYLAKNVAKLSTDEINANRQGHSNDHRTDAALNFASDVVSRRGHVDIDAVAKVKAAGFSDEEVVEIITHVALNTLTNYMNSVLRTEIDFPAATILAA